MNNLLPYEMEMVGFLCQNNSGMRDVVNAVVARQSRSIEFHRRECESLGGTPAALTYEFPVLPVCVQQASGGRITDVDGHQYVDCHMAYTAGFLGHNPPEVFAEVRRAMERGIGGGHLFAEQVELGELVRDMVPGVDRVAFYHTGGEAINAAVRIARAATGKRLVAKFEGCYHGSNEFGLHNSWMLFSPRIPSDPLEKIRPASATAGAVTLTDEDLLILPYNSPVALDLIAEHASELACVLADPMAPFLAPWPEESRRFIPQVQEATSTAGVPLIFDEVVCGFRMAKGGAREWLECNPQMSCFGKITSGLGIPLSMVAGESRFMDTTCTSGFRDAASRKVWLASTLSSSFIPVVASLAQMRLLNANYDDIVGRVDRSHAELSERLRDFSQTSGIPVELQGHPRMQSHLDLRSSTPAERSFRGLMADMTPNYYRSLLALTFYLRLNGVYTKTVPCVNLSAGHTAEDIELLAEAIGTSLQSMQRDGMLPA